MPSSVFNTSPFLALFARCKLKKNSAKNSRISSFKKPYAYAPNASAYGSSLTSARRCSRKFRARSVTLKIEAKFLKIPRKLFNFSAFLKIFSIWSISQLELKVSQFGYRNYDAKIVENFHFRFRHIFLLIFSPILIPTSVQNTVL